MLVDQRARLGATATVSVPMIATTIMSSVIVKPLCRIRASSSLVLLTNVSVLLPEPTLCEDFLAYLEALDSRRGSSAKVTL